MLDPTGKCTTCGESPQAGQTITCATCCNHFHGLCSAANDNNFICKKSFLSAWHSPSVKANFQWNCDSCKTIIEEREVCKMENKFEKLYNMVSALSNELTSVKDTLGDEINVVKTALSSLTSSETSSDIPQLQNMPNSNSPWFNKSKVQNMKSSLIIKSKDGSTNSDKEADLAKLKTLAGSNKIPVTRVGFDKNGNTYVDCPTAEGSSLLKPLLAANFQDKNVSEVKEKLPSISIVGIQEEITKSNFVSLLCKQNPEIDTLITAGEEFNVLFVKSARDGTYTAVVRVSSVIRNIIRSMRNRVYFGLSSCRVFDRFYVKRCNHCQEFGHYKENCCNPVSCAYCSGDHESDSCNLKESTDATKFSCVNCKRAGKEHTGHTAFAFNCPSYTAAQNRLRSTIPYYDNIKNRPNLNK